MANEGTGSNRPLPWWRRLSVSKPGIVINDFSNHLSEAEFLKVERVELRVNENGVKHRTGRYELMTREDEPHLVVRRGQDFILDILFDRPVNNENWDVSLVFALKGQKSKLSLGNGTLIELPLFDEEEPSVIPWFAHIKNIMEKQITVQVTASPTCIIGRWTLSVDTKVKNNDVIETYVHPTPLYMLFNPWCPEDDVFLAGDKPCQEYVLEDVGLIWTQNYDQPLDWAFSQFDSDVLDCAMDLLVHRKSYLTIPQRGLCPSIVRALAAMVNAQDDHGVLVGCWTGNYHGGVKPVKWSGSLKILQKWYATRKPVKYGQCWVFAGLLTTLCRALGIPCRPVTNYESGHDRDGSLTIDEYLDKEGNSVKPYGEEPDSSWNFHVWNEVWMKRADLGPDYSGWQVIDGTPQEPSDGVIRMGPASVEACKRGEIQLPYDGDFLYSEVNADVLTWIWNGPKHRPKLLWSEVNDDYTRKIGRRISTKAIGKDEREDITANYKHPEGSIQERDIMHKALKQKKGTNHCSRFYLNESFNDVRFRMSLFDDVVVGEPFTVTIGINNVSTTPYKGKAFLKISSCSYTGKIKSSVMIREFEFDLGPEKEERYPHEITYDSYAKYVLGEDRVFKISCFATVENTDFDFYTKDVFTLKNPGVALTTPKQNMYEGEDFEVTVAFRNPLPIPLTKGFFRIEAPGCHWNQLDIKLKRSIKVGETISETFELRPRVSGRNKILAHFHSMELSGASGHAEIEILPSENDIMPN